MIGILSLAFISTRSLAVSKNMLLCFFFLVRLSLHASQPASCLIQLTKVAQCATDTGSLNDFMYLLLVFKKSDVFSVMI